MLFDDDDDYPYCRDGKRRRRKGYKKRGLSRRLTDAGFDFPDEMPIKAAGEDDPADAVQEFWNRHFAR